MRSTNDAPGGHDNEPVNEHQGTHDRSAALVERSVRSRPEKTARASEPSDFEPDPGRSLTVKLHELSASDAPCCRPYRDLLEPARTTAIAAGGVMVHQA